ncbi:MAG: PLP-dependent aminotransferase family protein [Solirubrobacteraceae bacterium]
MDFQIDLDRSRPLRSQVERELRDGIRSGRLRPGTRLPPTRLFAEQVGVSRGVIVAAYAQLSAEGYLVAQYGGGTRVAEGLVQPAIKERRRPAARPRIRYDLRTGLPDASLFPRQTWSTAVTRSLRELPDAALLYGPPQGMTQLRRAIAGYLGRVRSVRVDDEQTFITTGSSAALGILWQALRARGARRVAFEDPCWSKIPLTIEQAGLEPVPVPVDEDGLVVIELTGRSVDAVVVAPAHQYPTGAVLHPARRAELIRWAHDQGALIVEDDYDAEYRYDGDPIAPLQSLAPERVAYLGTSSKTFAPALRLGWLIVPSELAAEVARQHEITFAQPSALVQASYAGLLERGEVDRHLRKTRRVYRGRRAALVSAVDGMLPHARLCGGAAGLHMIAWLAPGTDEVLIAEEALRRGVGVDALRRDCAAYGPTQPALVLGYGAISEPAIAPAIRELAACMSG